ncbi:MAG: transposase [Thermoguttaceae bacterium]|nr:transposase [Thermoguttaceae bacterium]
MLSQSIPRLKRFAKSLRVHASGILAWFDYQIAAGPLKGPNNKMKVIKTKAYGFRNYRVLQAEDFILSYP